MFAGNIDLPGPIRITRGSGGFDFSPNQNEPALSELDTKLVVAWLRMVREYRADVTAQLDRLEADLEAELADREDDAPGFGPVPGAPRFIEVA